jgi:hypothetical protein
VCSLRPSFHAVTPSARSNGVCDRHARRDRDDLWPFDGLRACKPTVIVDGHDRANCGTQAFIAALTVSAIRDVRKTRGADHAGWMSTG